jgi:DivIVA domain-containing protein
VRGWTSSTQSSAVDRPAGEADTRAVGEHEPPHHDEDERAVRLIDVRDPLPEELRDPTFHGAVRGYDRRAVDEYVQRINQVIAELQVAGSPSAAVRHALDRVGEQTSGILHHARETAEEITRSAREEADRATGRARAEASQIVAAARAKADEILSLANEQAESLRARAQLEAEGRTREAEEEVAARREDAEEQLRALAAEIAAVTDERRAVSDEVRRMAARLEAAVAEPPRADAGDA